MKTIRIQIARWLARRGMNEAQKQRRDLRLYIKRADYLSQREYLKARGRRPYAAWLDPRVPGWQAAPRSFELCRETGTASVEGIRRAIANIHFERSAA